MLEVKLMATVVVVVRDGCGGGGDSGGKADSGGGSDGGLRCGDGWR